MNINSISFQGKTKEKKTRYIAQSIATATVAPLASLASLPISLPVLNKVAKISQYLSADEIKIVNKAAEKVIDNTNLRKTGLEIINYTDAGKNITGIPDKILGILNPLFATAKGENAMFTDKPIQALGGEFISKNKVIINQEKLSLSAFHEIGHAFNNNMSKGWKILQKMRIPGITIASSLAILAAFTKKSESTNGKELTKAQKTKNFVHDKAGLLAFTAMIPTLLEEGKASLRGNKWAKELLSPQLAKKVKNANNIAYISYLATATALGLAAFTATKMKDKLVEKKQAKLANQ